MITLLLLLCTTTAYGAEFQTGDPLNAFVYGEYPLGDDYFIKGNADTHILRCILTTETEGLEGIALSEISIWGIVEDHGKYSEKIQAAHTCTQDQEI